ncbi:MAG: uroporphyrinogen-III synthase [Thaumarchaeota archaeon]|nr:uroporphyrinogen-III synthase [Nitrososphaerota archaeon]
MARGRGIRAHALPTIQLVSKGDKIVNEFLDAARAESPDYAVFMSSKAVRLLFDTARKLDKGGGPQTGEAEAADGGSAAQPGSTYERLRLAVANMTVVAVGPKTRDSLESEGVRVNEMPPKTYSSVGVGELFTGLNAVGRKAIVPRSGASTPFLRELLEKIGLGVVELHLYDVCAFSDTAAWNGFRAEFAGGRVDGIVFTSASSVRGFVEIMSKDFGADALTERLSRTAVVAIGPFTADELKKKGVTHNVISEVHTVRGAFETMAREIGA